MQYLDLLCAHPNVPTLSEFAKTFFHVVGISDGQERESSNYPDGYYFKGSRGGIEFKISLADEDGNEDLPIWIHVSADGVEGGLEDAIGLLVREKLLLAGFRAARMVNFGRRDEQRVDYL